MEYSCLTCTSNHIKEIMNFGVQPQSNIYLSNPKDLYEQHPLRVAVCEQCGTVQLIDPMPAAKVSCKHPWLRYNEPEAHLDQVADTLAGYLRNGATGNVHGLSYKDGTLIQRMARRGFPVCEQNILENGEVGIERVQELVTNAWADEKAATLGKADMLIVRHVLEHAHRPREFVDACRRLVSDGGYLIFEVPGSEGIFETRQHNFIWEEHILYFTEETLRHFLSTFDLEVVRIATYPTPLEPSLVAFTRCAARSRASGPRQARPEACLRRAHAFAASFPERKARLRDILAKETSGGDPCVVFGAGHLSSKFVNFYDLSGFIERFIDDNPDKQGCCLPGNFLQITPSGYLDTLSHGKSLLGTTPSSHQKILSKNTRFTQNGGRWFSMYAGATNSIGGPDI